MLSTQISFPGFGIDPFVVNPTAFSIFGIEIKWYALIIVTGILFAIWYVYWRSRKTGLLVDDLLDIALWVVFPGIICARLYYVIFKKLENPNMFTTFKEIIDIRSGGLAIYGGIIGGAIMAILVLKFKKIRILPFLDFMAPGVMAAQAIGRWGNFMNAEAHGGETTMPWRMGLYKGGQWIYVHPTFLYESLWNLLGFILIMLFYKKRKYDGQILFFYLSWYGLGRMIIEGMRTDSLYIGNSGIRVSQLIAGIAFVLFSFLLIAMELNWKPIKHPQKKIAKFYNRLVNTVNNKTIADNIYYPQARHFNDARKVIQAYEQKQAHRAEKKKKTGEE